VIVDPCVDGLAQEGAESAQVLRFDVVEFTPTKTEPGSELLKGL
jgi:hypothetical protein